MRSVRQADKNDAKGTVALTGITALTVIGLVSGRAGGGSAEVRYAPGRQQAPHAPAAGPLGSYATRLLTRPRGTKGRRTAMPDMIRRFLDEVTGEGYAVARLGDHL
ncbi:hypothetical protein ACFRDV_28730 [Streptomyces fagopyri]|uniref:hypothetical protein n=1 Tax=Streptomyces fagopyri TaxID=2662397 RepID=UPI0036BA0E62